jgi:trk system potassium uptake protein TrkA
MKKQVVVVGLGRFGASVARELYQMGNDVLALDTDEALIQEMLGQVTYAVKADATNEAVLRELGVQNFDVGVIGVGADIQASILATVLLKSLGVPFIIARAGNALHGDTLERIGADKVVYPERETGVRVAHILFNPGVLDYMEINSGFGIMKLRPPDRMVNRTLEAAGLSDAREKYGIAVMAIRRGREHILIPSKEEVIRAGDQLVLAGRDEHLSRLQEITREAEAAT